MTRPIYTILPSDEYGKIIALHVNGAVVYGYGATVDEAVADATRKTQS